MRLRRSRRRRGFACRIDVGLPARTCARAGIVVAGGVRAALADAWFVWGGAGRGGVCERQRQAGLVGIGDVDARADQGYAAQRELTPEEGGLVDLQRRVGRTLTPQERLLYLGEPLPSP